MAKILKCPGCQQSMDVTSIEPGSTVQCPDCGKNVRVATGATSVRAKTVSPPIPPPVPVPAPQKSSSGLFIGLGIGAVAVIAVIAFFTMKHDPVEPVPTKQPPRETG